MKALHPHSQRQPSCAFPRVAGEGPADGSGQNLSSSAGPRTAVISAYVNPRDLRRRRRGGGSGVVVVRLALISDAGFPNRGNGGMSAGRPARRAASH